MNREVPMLAEIFMLRLEVKARDGKEAAATTSSRFVPVTLPVVKAGRDLHAQTGSKGPRGNGGYDELAVRPRHVAGREGVLIKEDQMSQKEKLLAAACVVALIIACVAGWAVADVDSAFLVF
jgi:hypothetical protein